MWSVTAREVGSCMESFESRYHAGGTDGTAPSEMKAYINREDLDFDTVSHLPALQKWDLQENLRGEIEYPTK